MRSYEPFFSYDSVLGDPISWRSCESQCFLTLPPICQHLTSLSLLPQCSLSLRMTAIVVPLDRALNSHLFSVPWPNRAPSNHCWILQRSFPGQNWEQYHYICRHAYLQGNLASTLCSLGRTTRVPHRTYNLPSHRLLTKFTVQTQIPSCWVDIKSSQQVVYYSNNRLATIAIVGTSCLASLYCCT